MTLLLSESDVAQVLTMDVTLSAVDRALRLQGSGEGSSRPRQRVRTGSVLLNILAGGSGTAAGLKFYCGQRGGMHFYAALFDGEHGQLLALIQADRLGQMRTGAASGIATRTLSRPDASVHGLFGTGWQAESQALAVCAVRPIRLVKVYGRDRSKGESFCDRLAAATGVEFRFTADPEAVVRNSDIVTTMTTATQPLFDGGWLEEGVHVNAAGVNRASAREIDSATVENADLVVVDLLEQAQQESGDLIAAAAEGAFDWQRAVELGGIVSGQIPGRTRPDQRTLFKSNGIALWDVAVMEEIYRLARERGLGHDVAF